MPREREGEFATEVFERYKRMSGDVEEAVLEMYLSGISVRKIVGLTEALSRVKVAKEAVRAGSRQETRRRAKGVAGAAIGGEGLPLRVAGRHLPEGPLGLECHEHGVVGVRWSGVGVDEEGFGEVLAVEVAGSEKGAAYASLLRGLIDRDLWGWRLVVCEDHEGIKAAVRGELAGVGWQRCVVHFERNMLSHVCRRAR